jgi:GntR family transcriptional regulator/MocR family aminotransferase
VRAAWSTDILLAIDREAPHTLRGQLEGQLREAMATGRLAAGTVLPSTRELAACLELSRGVVVEAYEQLAAEGWIVSKRGSGTRVAKRARVPATAEPPQSPAATYRFDFKPGLPHAESFPRRAWAGCLRDAALHATAAQLGYPDPRGDEGARVALARYLARARAVVAHPSCVVMCSGFTQAIDLIARVWVERGMSRVAIEQPGFVGLATHLNRLGLQVLPVPVDREGLDPRQLERSGAQAVILAPAHQFPTGAVLSAARRVRLAAWARERGAWIVEDDYDAEFRYEAEPLPALQGSAPGHTIYVGTASKLLSPALRLGWVVAPEPLVGALALMKRRVDRGGSSIDQIALGRFVEDGLLDRHLKRCRGAYRRRRDTLLAALSRWGFVDEVMGAAAGLHVMVRLRRDVDEERVVAEARRAGLRVFGGAAYRQGGVAGAPALVLGYGAIAENDIDAAVAALAAVVRRCGADDARAAAREADSSDDVAVCR